VKKVLKPAEKEDVVYYSDFSGKFYDECGSPCELQFTFNYGSKFDGGGLHFYLSDEEALEILQLIRSKLSKDTKEEYKEIISACEKNYSNSEYQNSIELLKYMVDEREGDVKDA